MIIREAVLSDLEQIYSLVLQVGKLHADSREDIFITNAVTISICKLKERIEGHKYHVIVACKNEKVIGVMMAYVKHIESDIKFRNSNVLRIEEVVVEKEYRGKNVAQELMKHMKAYALTKECDRVESNVWGFNEQSRRFFEKERFSKQQEVMEFLFKKKDWKSVSSLYKNVEKENQRHQTIYKKIEFDNTIGHILDEINSPSKILDCAAGNGAYAFALAEKGNELTVSDLSKEHIAHIKKMCQDAHIQMKCYVDDAMDLSRHEDNSFDYVLCMGPIYHMDRESGKRCLAECLRIVKPGGKIFVSYLNKLFWGPYVLQHKYPECSLEMVLGMMENGYLDMENGDFISLAFFYSPDEIKEVICEDENSDICEHFTLDSNWASSYIKINEMDEKELELLKTYIYNHSKQKDQIYVGKNNMIVIQKKFM